MTTTFVFDFNGEVLMRFASRSAVMALLRRDLGAFTAVSQDVWQMWTADSLFEIRPEAEANAE